MSFEDEFYLAGLPPCIRETFLKENASWKLRIRASRYEFCAKRSSLIIENSSNITILWKLMLTIYEFYETIDRVIYLCSRKQQNQAVCVSNSFVIFRHICRRHTLCPKR